MSCRVINYLRYILRFISAYIIVAFTIQRVIIVRSPLTQKFKSTKSAWKTVLVITLISIIINLWVCFIFKINYTDTKQYCDVNRDLKKSYFRITVIYIILIMLIPMVTIFTGNFIIIKYASKADKERTNLIKLNQQSNEKLKDINKLKNVNTLNTSKISKLSGYEPNRSSFLNLSASANNLNMNISVHKLSQASDDKYHVKIYYPPRNQMCLKPTNKVNFIRIFFFFFK